MCFGYLLATVVCYNPVVWSSRYFDSSFFFPIWLKLPICWFCSICWITTYSYSNDCEQSLFQKSSSSSFFYQAWMYQFLRMLYSCWICSAIGILICDALLFLLLHVIFHWAEYFMNRKFFSFRWWFHSCGSISKLKASPWDYYSTAPCVCTRSWY